MRMDPKSTLRVGREALFLRSAQVITDEDENLARCGYEFGGSTLVHRDTMDKQRFLELPSGCHKCKEVIG